MAGDLDCLFRFPIPSATQNTPRGGDLLLRGARLRGTQAQELPRHGAADLGLETKRTKIGSAEDDFWQADRGEILLKINHQSQIETPTQALYAFV